MFGSKINDPFDKANHSQIVLGLLYGYFWTGWQQVYLVCKGQKLHENINVFAVDPKAAPSANGVPESRNLTPKDEVTAQIYNVSQNNPDLDDDRTQWSRQSMVWPLRTQNINRRINIKNTKTKTESLDMILIGTTSCVFVSYRRKRCYNFP